MDHRADDHGQRRKLLRALSEFRSTADGLAAAWNGGDDKPKMTLERETQGKDRQGPAGAAHADLIVRNAKISTMRPGMADTEALAVHGETFLAAGTDTEVMRFADRRLSRLEALPLYTTGSAWFSGEEEAKGTITAGQYADFAILSGDYLAVEEKDISRIESVLTVTGGNVVCSAPPFADHAPPALTPDQP
jgi:hypothetical protein